MLRDMFSCELTPSPTFYSYAILSSLALDHNFVGPNLHQYGNPDRTIDAEDFL